uniref:ALIX V-shaped domain-containing protein n=1 Tax=Hucho hucho TaxID=62062 RepID=A0A4W5KGC2_9TELE
HTHTHFPLILPSERFTFSILSFHLQLLVVSPQASHQEFSKLKQSNSEANDREEVLKKLASAHDSYVEITSNLREGTKFYNDLTEILLKFQNKCSDIVFARKTERDELLKDLQQSIAREPSAPSFNVPVYQTNPAPTAADPTPAPRTVFVSSQSSMGRWEDQIRGQLCTKEVI